MADLSDGANWFETDGANNRPPPNGWPEGMMPSGVNDTARADKGALKRFWDRINPVQGITPSGGVWTFTTSNPAYPTSYVNGEVYTFVASVPNAGGDQFQVNALGAKPIWKRVSYGSGFTPVVAQDILNPLPPQLIYNGSLNGGSGAFVLVNPFVPISSDGGGGISTGNAAISGALSVSGGITAASLSSTGGISASGNISASGTISGAALSSSGTISTGGTVQGGYIHSTGNVQADNAVTSPTMTATGTIQGAFVHSTGNVVADVDVGCRDLNAGRNVNATAGTVTAAQLTSTGNANIAGTCTAAHFVGNFSVEYTVAGLPAPTAALRGTRAHVVDVGLSSRNFMDPVTTGGGSFVMPVFCTGTQWVFA